MSPIYNPPYGLPSCTPLFTISLEFAGSQGLHLSGPRPRILGLYLPCCALHSINYTHVQDQWQMEREKRSSGDMPPPSEKAPVTEGEGSLPSELLVLWVLAATAVAKRKFVSQFVKPEQERFS